MNLDNTEDSDLALKRLKPVFRALDELFFHANTTVLELATGDDKCGFVGEPPLCRILDGAQSRVRKWGDESFAVPEDEGEQAEVFEEMELALRTFEHAADLIRQRLYRAARIAESVWCSIEDPFLDLNNRLCEAAHATGSMEKAIEFLQTIKGRYSAPGAEESGSAHSHSESGKPAEYVGDNADELAGARARAVQVLANISDRAAPADGPSQPVRRRSAKKSVRPTS